MVRIGKWNEKKIYFEGGTYPLHIATSGIELKHGATTFGDASGDISVDTGLTSVMKAWLNVKGATAAWVSATSGATITCHPNATAGDFDWFAFGYI